MMSIVSSNGTASPPKSALHILFVDDEEMLGRMTGKQLTLTGHTAEVFTVASETLEAFRRQPDAFDLVITDLTMPDMSGLVLAEAIKAIRPHTPVILSTGFSEMLDEEEAYARGVDLILSKPVGIGELKAGIEKAMQK